MSANRLFLKTQYYKFNTIQPFIHILHNRKGFLFTTTIIKTRGLYVCTYLFGTVCICKHLLHSSVPVLYSFYVILCYINVHFVNNERMNSFCHKLNKDLFINIMYVLFSE